MDTEYQLRKEWWLDIKTVSEANISEHWTKKRKRHILQKRLIWLWSIENNIKATTLPITVRLTRIATKTLDSDDNLRMAFKWIKDYIADAILPGQAAGQADSDPRLTWQYSQIKGNPKEIAMKISFFY